MQVPVDVQARPEMTATGETASSAQSDSPTSRFTAVNVKEQEQSGGPLNSNGSMSRGSEERPNGQPRINPPGQEKLTITTSSRDDWAPPPPVLNSGDRHSYQPLAVYAAGTEESAKRKRSGSLDQTSSSANTYHSHALSSSTKQTPTTATTESDEPRQESSRAHLHPDPREQYGPDVHYRQYVASNEDHRDPGSRSDQWHHGYQQHNISPEEQHLGDALRQSMDGHQREYISPGDDDRNHYGGYGQDRREMSASSDPKKRKRNFSNRTKTGCMTCRKRKKKCDESKPECNNCFRGGFVCGGYQGRNNWPKQESKPQPILLQSKVEYDKAEYDKVEYENSPYAPNPSPYASLGNQRREPLPGYRGQTLRVDPQHGRHTGMEDDLASASTLPSASVASPENSRLLSAISYSQQTPTPITASSSAYPDRHPKDPYSRVGSLHDNSRQNLRSESDTGTPQSASSSLPQILHPQMHVDSPHTNPQVAAQLALGLSTRPRSQKEEMLAGRNYFPFDKELVLERERCNAACWRFNSSTNPNNGVSPEERARQFRDILHPREHGVSPSQNSPSSPMPRVGDNVVVEAPFNCDYGYNISIGQDVAIGKNCTILDTCDVKIGDRCMIGPNVNIYTATLPIDPKRRLGSRGPSLGKSVIIESDCWIGGNVTILPGRTIGRGSTVGAGSVVTRNVPPYVVSCGNPARVIRGIGELDG